MNTKRTLSCFLYLMLHLIVGIQAGGQEPSERYTRAIGFYQEGNYDAALEIWMDMYSAGYEDFELLYNTGNAWFKSGGIPMAILFYERAALRKPWDKDLKYNLALARSQIRDRYDEIPQVFFVRWLNLLSLLLNTDTWASISVTSFLLALAALLFFLFTSRYGVKVTAFWTSAFLILVFLVSLSLAFMNKRLVYNSRKAIVVAPVITGRSAPSDGSNELFVIHEGLKVGTGEQIGEWCEITLPDGNKGWVPVKSIEVI